MVCALPQPLCVLTTVLSVARADRPPTTSHARSLREGLGIALKTGFHDIISPDKARSLTVVHFY